MQSVPYRLAAPRRQRKNATPPFHVWTVHDDAPWLEFYRRRHDYLLRFPGLADFSLKSDGTDIVCHPAPGTDRDTIEHLYLNQVVPLARNGAGALCFHGSAIVIGDQAIAFLGPSGRGKSTLAASFAVSGRPFLTDDGLIAELRGGDYHALPSHPSIRLWDDSQEEVLAADANSILPVNYSTKSRLLASERLAYCGQSKPLLAAYFLGEGTADDVVIDALPAADLAVRFLSNSFQLDIENRGALLRGFDATAELCNQVRGFTLDYPREFDRLSQVRELVTLHAMSIARR